MFQEFSGTRDQVLLKYTEEEIFQQVRDAAGIHFSSFKDPEQGQSVEEDEALQAGAQPMEPNWKPDAAWRAKNMAPAKPWDERGLKWLE